MAETARIELDTTAMQDYARYLQQAPEIAREEMERSVEEALLLLERELKENTPVGAHGLLRGSITHQLRGASLSDGIGVAGTVGSSLNYALPVELGTKPHFPPLAPLRDWVEKKLGVDPSRSEHVAYLIARKIAKRGTKGARMAGKTLDAQAGQVNQIIAGALPRILARLAGGNG
jgi:hypothetical protein